MFRRMLQIAEATIRMMVKLPRSEACQGVSLPCVSLVLYCLQVTPPVFFV